ncbi:hypothetical protein LZ554_007142 [Drepanopeziza brunnea f. sp. 'monogermtubi']|nr:hypothetical protein LZ554_007142 [Drepanopeziza brunnea f. sp. 'monogermtubi']
MSTGFVNVPGAQGPSGIAERSQSQKIETVNGDIWDMRTWPKFCAVDNRTNPLIHPWSASIPSDAKPTAPAATSKPDILQLLGSKEKRGSFGLLQIRVKVDDDYPSIAGYSA